MNTDIIYHEDNASNTAVLGLVKESLKRKRGSDPSKRVRITVEVLEDFEPYEQPYEGTITPEEWKCIDQALWSTKPLALEEEPVPLAVTVSVMDKPNRFAWVTDIVRTLFQ